jgi:hypothetical protein
MRAYFTACGAYFRILLFNSISAPKRFKYAKLVMSAIERDQQQQEILSYSAEHKTK